MKKTQFGTFTVIVLLPIIAFLLYQLLKLGFNEAMPQLILGGVLVVLIICLFFFYRLTIVVDYEHVSFKMGVGWFGRKYKIDSIKSCKAVKNPLWYGIGIRILPKGMLYNVSGLSAIELKFKNKKGIVRIGTDKADEIASYITEKLDNNDVVENIVEKRPTKRPQKQLILFWSIVLFIILLVVGSVVYGKQEPKVSIHNKILEISGAYGQDIPIDSIFQIDMLTNIPNIELRTNGFAFGGTCKGNFRLKGISNAKLYIVRGFSPYILIKTYGDETIFINYKDKQKTIGLYEKILATKK